MTIRSFTHPRIKSTRTKFILTVEKKIWDVIVVFFFYTTVCTTNTRLRRLLYNLKMHARKIRVDMEYAYNVLRAEWVSERTRGQRTTKSRLSLKRPVFWKREKERSWYHGLSYFFIHSFYYYIVIIISRIVDEKFSLKEDILKICIFVILDE